MTTAENLRKHICALGTAEQL